MTDTLSTPLGEWTDRVLSYALLMRWLVHRDPGYPTLLVRSGHALFVELQTNRGVLDAAQMAWRDRLIHAGQDWRCWRPRHWPEVEHTLKLAPASSWREHEDIAVKGRLL